MQAWACLACNFNNTNLVKRCEQCETARQGPTAGVTYIAPARLVMGAELGAGTFGKVLRATLDGTTPVAVKVFTGSAQLAQKLVDDEIAPMLVRMVCAVRVCG